MVVASVAALVLLSPAAASRADPPASPPVVSRLTKPDWTRIPNSDDVARYYPERAARLALGGKVVLDCGVTEKGTLEDCAVVSETPPDEEFGVAALRMSKLFHLKPMTVDGTPVSGARVRVPIVFRPPEPEVDTTVPIEVVTANLAKSLPLDGTYVGIFSLSTARDAAAPLPYMRLPTKRAGKKTIEVQILGVARTPGPWRGSELGFTLTRMAYDCGKRRTRVISTTYFDAAGATLLIEPVPGDWMPTADKSWSREVLTMACGGDASMPWPKRDGVAQVIEAVRNGEGPLPPVPLYVPPVPALRPGN